MKFKIQLITQRATGEEIQELACLERETEGLDAVGITLAEATTLLATLQRRVVKQQIAAYLTARQCCPHCAQAFRHKDQHPVVVRTLFGNLEFPSPRWFQCGCQPHATRTFSPLADLFTEPCSSERLYLETKWASLVSYELAAQLPEDVLPTDTQSAPLACVIICSAWRNGPRLGSALSNIVLSKAVRGNGRRYRARRRLSPWGLMAVFSGSGITTRCTSK